MMMMMVVQGSRDNPSTSLSTSKKWIKTIPSFIVKKESSDNFNAAIEKQQEDDDSLVNYSNSIAMRQQTHYLHSSLFQSLMKLRGGDEEDEIDYDEESDSEDDDDDEDSNGNDMYQKVLDVTKTKIVPVVMTYSKKVAITIKKGSITFYHAMQRAISAGLEVVEDDEVEDDDEDEDEEGDVYEVIAKKLIKFCTKSMKKIQRMVKAAMTIPEDEGSNEDDDDEDDENEEETIVGNDVDAEENDDVTATESKEKDDSSDMTTSTSISSLDVKETSVKVELEEETTITTKKIADFGSYLAENYSVEDKRATDDDNNITILGGSLSDAFKIAREQARMLIVFIPSEKPKSESWFGGVGVGKQTNANDQIAIESLLSGDVMKAANKKARKKGEAGLGSFAIWGSKTGSLEATSAMKRLKIKATSTTGEKRPILCVIYPAQDVSYHFLSLLLLL
jgi:hypothetical protein